AERRVDVDVANQAVGRPAPEQGAGLGIQPPAGGTLEIGEHAHDDGGVRRSGRDAGRRGMFGDRAADVHGADRFVTAADRGVERGSRGGNGDGHEGDGEGAWLHGSLLVSMRLGLAGRRGGRAVDPAAAAAAGHDSSILSSHTTRSREPSGIRYVPTSVICATLTMKGSAGHNEIGTKSYRARATV